MCACELKEFNKKITKNSRKIERKSKEKFKKNRKKFQTNTITHFPFSILNSAYAGSPGWIEEEEKGR